MKKTPRAPKQSPNAGVAMILVLCISALFLALALALAYSASVLTATANQKLQRERCYQLAKSFSEVTAAELCTAEPVPKVNSLPPDSMFLYANKFLEGYYAEYDPDHIGDTTYSYGVLGSGDDSDPYGSLVVTLYKEVSDEEGETTEEGVPTIDLTPIPEEDLPATLNTIEARRFNDYSFSVQATAGLGQDSYTYYTRYYRTVTYQVNYRLRVGGAPLYRQGGRWYRDAGCTQPYTGTVTGRDLLASYDIGNILTKQFTREGEGSLE